MCISVCMAIDTCHIYFDNFIYVYSQVSRFSKEVVRDSLLWYGVATISSLLKILGLFHKRALYKRRYSAKETYNFKEPTNCRHDIQVLRFPKDAERGKSSSVEEFSKCFLEVVLICTFDIWRRGGGLGSRPKKMYGERLGDGVEYHLMSPTPRC